MSKLGLILYGSNGPNKRCPMSRQLDIDFLSLKYRFEFKSGFILDEIVPKAAENKIYINIVFKGSSSVICFKARRNI